MQWLPTSGGPVERPHAVLHGAIRGGRSKRCPVMISLAHRVPDIEYCVAHGLFLYVDLVFSDWPSSGDINSIVKISGIITLKFFSLYSCINGLKLKFRLDYDRPPLCHG